MSVRVQTTPNPNARKFVCDRVVIAKGRANFKNYLGTERAPMAADLLSILGVKQVHLFEDIVTITQDGEQEWDDLEPRVIRVIGGWLPRHNPVFTVDDSEVDRSTLPPERQRLEEILDRLVRPALRADGGDVRVHAMDGPHLVLKYEGACGTCPSSTLATLDGIKALLRDEYHPETEVEVLR